MQEVLEAEDLDSDGNPLADQPPKKRKTKTKHKKAAPKRVDTDPEDEDFDGEESAESDSENEVEITNVEVRYFASHLTLPKFMTHLSSRKHFRPKRCPHGAEIALSRTKARVRRQLQRSVLHLTIFTSHLLTVTTRYRTLLNQIPFLGTITLNPVQSLDRPSRRRRA